jgi:transposase
VCPGNNESAGQHHSTHTRGGDLWLTSALAEAAWGAVRTKDCYLGVRFRRIARRRGQQRALIAIAHSLLIICWHLLTENTTYTELGPDYLAGRDDPERRKRYLVHQLEQLGQKVTLEPAA